MRVFEFVRTELLKGFTPDEELAVHPLAEDDAPAEDDGQDEGHLTSDVEVYQLVLKQESNKQLFIMNGNYCYFIILSFI